MTVGTWGLTTYSASTSSTAAFDYKTQIDQNFLVAQRFGQSFAPHEQSTGDLTIRLDAGFLWSGLTLTEVAAQNTTAIASPSGSPRIDRVVIDPLTGLASIVSGTAAETPVKPSIPTGYVPICSVYLAVGTVRIGNSMITDERAVWGQDLPGDYQEFTTTGVSTWSKPIGFSSDSLVRAMIWGGGGGGSTESAGGGGGGGACFFAECRLGELSTAVSVTVAAGGSCTASTDAQAQPGGNSSFGSSWIGYGGGGGFGAAGCFFGGSGGGWWTSGQFISGGLTTRGAPLPATVAGNYSVFGGAWTGGSTAAVLGGSVWGGGGGGWVSFPAQSIYGGGGGGAGSTVGAYTGGPSIFGGNGGAGSTAGTGGVAGSAPGGGGGGGGNTGVGARGEVRVWVFRG